MTIYTASHPDTFKERLSTFLLTAFATGVDVKGTWDVADSDPTFPGFEVTITRSDAGPTLPQMTDDPTFEDALEDLLLREFAAGTDVEGHWAVRFSRPELPAWDVEIEYTSLERTRPSADSGNA